MNPEPLRAAYVVALEASLDARSQTNAVFFGAAHGALAHDEASAQPDPMPYTQSFTSLRSIVMEQPGPAKMPVVV